VTIACRGFTLIELAIVLFILTLLMAGVMTPLTQQLTARQEADTRRALEEARISLLGYAISHRDAGQRPYLPCPDRRDGARPGQANDGLEDRLPDGRCATLAGNLPWLGLGLAETDAWGNRLTYAVAPGYAHGAEGIRPHPAPPATLKICLDRDCARHALVAAVLLSHGRNGLGARNAAGGRNRPPNGQDELENADADEVFISRAMAAADRPGGEFDDQVVWLSPSQLFGRLCGEAAACGAGTGGAD
jgi:prepilin-type N-terminal cleavage/methylation domain-containing protein